MSEQTQDPYAAAMAAQPPKPIYWGSLLTDAHFVVLEKGIGRIPFDPQVHEMSRRVTALDFSLLPIAEMGFTNSVERNAIAEFGEWTRIIKPSIEALGVDLRELHDKYVKVEMVPTGRTYKNSAGEDVKATTFKFLKLFANENECVADYLSGDEDEPEAAPAQAAAPAAAPAPAATETPTNDPERETALKFLEVLVDNAVSGQKDINVVNQTLQISLEATPLVAKYFKVDSPEAVQLIMSKMGA